MDKIITTKIDIKNKTKRLYLASFLSFLIAICFFIISGLEIDKAAEKNLAVTIIAIVAGVIFLIFTFYLIKLIRGEKK